MAEYINKHDLINRIFHYAANNHIKYDILTEDIFMSLIDGMPSTDVQPVKHGRWLLDNPQYLLSHCSECQCFNSIGYNWKYCPNCGADMRTNYDELQRL